MNVLIIGYGSIGKRHEEVLREIDGISNIDIVSKQNIKDKRVYPSLDKAPLEKYDYFIISSETFKHFEQLSYINQKVENKLIFCEKPLFEDYKFFKPKNDIYVGYVLRYHPLLKTLKQIIDKENIYFSSVESGSYLPNWRIEGDYRKSYSASKKKGGGVLLDLSHELDYVEWLFGITDAMSCMTEKVSELDIEAEDLAVLNLKTDRNTHVNIILNYFSKIPIRKIIAHSKNSTFYVDLINNTLIVQDRNGVKLREIAETFDRNMMYRDMHIDVLGERLYAATYQQAISILKIINRINE
ncbi:Gfo/Idh/MocA family protein [Psychrobacter nivimaris]|uniref:Gfo/Idh/MocA family protein n=1 Tax=Psychrobacter nivimaris TaxID=281738 RepID=UPI001919B45C|nr:Gfo/Idh/MocA family oxidoreductase [Psychrobacter nivimaris]